VAADGEKAAIAVAVAAAETGAAVAAAATVAVAAAMAEAAVAADMAAHAKCTRQPAQNADRNAKSRSSRQKEGRYIARTALQSTGPTRFCFFYSFFIFTFPSGSHL
jgi:hypothetical protein